MDRKVLLGVGVAAAAAAALGGAAAAYLLLKEDESRSSGHVSSRPSAVDVRIRREDAGLVIGRGGENIREIQRRTNTRIHFRDERETETHRFLAINGSSEEVQLAEILIHQTIANQPRLETLVLTVPGFSVGTIIGHGGESIREIQYTSRCKVDVERTSGDGPRKITLKGTESQINYAKDLIDGRILVAQERQSTDPVRNTSKPAEVFLQAGIAAKPSLLYLKSDAEEEVAIPLNSNNRQEILWDPSKTDISTAQIIEVYVSSISDPSKFFVQKVGPMSIELDRLAEDMSDYYEVEANRVNCALAESDSVQEGDLVAAKFSSDNKWYRARVVSITTDDYDQSKTEVDVDFVDFGDYERMLKSEVCKLLPEFLKLTFQAIDCSLAHVEPIPGDDYEDSDSSAEEWGEECLEAFERLTHAAQWKVLMAKLVEFPGDDSSDQSVVIELIDGNTPRQDVNVGEELGKMGLVRYTCGGGPHSDQVLSNGNYDDQSEDGSW